MPSLTEGPFTPSASTSVYVRRATRVDGRRRARCEWALTLIVCAGVLSRRLSSWLTDALTVGHSVRFRCSHCQYVFITEQNDAEFITWIFFIKCLNGWVLPGSSLHSALVCMTIFSRNISQGSVETRLRCGGIFLCQNFTGKLVGERILKID